MGEKSLKIGTQSRRPAGAAVLAGVFVIMVGRAAAPAAFEISQGRKGRRPDKVDFRTPARNFENLTLVDPTFGDVTVSVEKQLKTDATCRCQQSHCPAQGETA